MTGVAFLREAMAIFPSAKRVLLTAYADTDAAIRAINEVKLDHYLMKPWHPPEEMLYPVLDDLLDDWRADYQPTFDGVRIIGHRWSADGHRVRDFLARNLVPYRWLDIESDPEATELRDLAGATDTPLPIVILPDSSVMSRPTVATLAERIGLHSQAVSKSYDLVVVGAGPAGLAAAVYGSSEGLRTLLVEREAPGGQAGTSSSIENYLGFPVGLSGGDLARRAVAQARRFGTEILTPAEATKLETQNGYHIVTLIDGSTVASQALLVATGVSYRLLDVPGADRLAGAGLFYGAAITEAIAVKDEDVFVVGGGNSAGQAALYLGRFARSVTILVRGKSLADTMSQYLIERLNEAENVHLRTGASEPSTATRASSRSRFLMLHRVLSSKHPPGQFSCSSAQRRAPSGSAGHCNSTRKAMYSRAQISTMTPVSTRKAGQRGASRSGWRPASRGFSWPATCGIALPSALHRPWEKARWRCSSCTSTCAASCLIRSP
jgi:thioredoxin reductase (NADPH)